MNPSKSDQAIRKELLNTGVIVKSNYFGYGRREKSNTKAINARKAELQGNTAQQIKRKPLPI